jgi:amidase
MADDLPAAPPQDPFGAFCTHDAVCVPGAGAGPLHGLTFAAKDNFDVAGFPACAGSPDWLRTHGPAARTAPAVQRLLDAGAFLVGKTQMDELAFSLDGRNAHYGTPVNPRTPDRIPGGSSSGSAVATAGGLVDFALGTDTVGSCRVPASHCGVWGFRPTHGRIPLEGAVPFSPSFDTVGWFARDPAVLRRVGGALLGEQPDAGPPGRLLVAEDAFALADEDVRATLQNAVRLAVAAAGQAQPVVLAPEGLADWVAQFDAVRGGEVWAGLGEWVERLQPAFGPGIRERFAAARRVTAGEVAAARARRQQIQDHLDHLLSAGDVVCLPTVPRPAPLRDSLDEVLAENRKRILPLTCIAPLGGLPQVTMPLAQPEGYPVGLSLLAGRGADARLLVLAEAVAKS